LPSAGQMGSFLPGHSVGGAATNHWGGLHWRYLRSDLFFWPQPPSSTRSTRQVIP